MEWPGRQRLADLEGFVELAPDVCPAACQDDAGVLGGMAAAGCVAVALEDAAEVSEQIADAGLLAARVPLIDLKGKMENSPDPGK